MKILKILYSDNSTCWNKENIIKNLYKNHNKSSNINKMIFSFLKICKKVVILNRNQNKFNI